MAILWDIVTQAKKLEGSDMPHPVMQWSQIVYLSSAKTDEHDLEEHEENTIRF